MKELGVSKAGLPPDFADRIGSTVIEFRDMLHPKAYDEIASFLKGVTANPPKDICVFWSEELESGIILK